MPHPVIGEVLGLVKTIVDIWHTIDVLVAPEVDHSEVVVSHGGMVESPTSTHDPLGIATTLFVGIVW